MSVLAMVAFSFLDRNMPYRGMVQEMLQGIRGRTKERIAIAVVLELDRRGEGLGWGATLGWGITITDLGGLHRAREAKVRVRVRSKHQDVINLPWRRRDARH
jgi:hypothetical protein